MGVTTSSIIFCLAFYLFFLTSGAVGSLEANKFLQSGLGKRLVKRYENAQLLAVKEQEVDDVNADFIATSPNHATSTTKRRVIVMPLDDNFDPPMGVFSHGHVQTGDKISLPRVFWDAIQLNEAEVPWLFKVSRIPGITDDRVTEKDSIGNSEEQEDDDVDSDDEDEKEEVKKKEPGAPQSMEPLDSVVGSPLDFRAPPNYAFLPYWMMRALGLKPRDVVDIELITTVPPGSLAKLRPLSSETLKDITNPQAVMETELRHYSSLTKGSTIAFDYNKKRYWFEVAQLRSAPRGEKQNMIKVQDCDIATDFLPAKDTLKKKGKGSRK